MLYSYGHFDFDLNEIKNNTTLYDTLNEVQYAINYDIIHVINNKFDIILNDEYLFILNPISKEPYQIEQKLVINKNTTLFFSKNERSIDISICEISKGYIYNSKKQNKQIYKFFIGQYEQSEQNEDEVDPFIVTRPVVVNVQPKRSTSLYKPVKMTLQEEVLLELTERLKDIKYD